ncbi:MAG TPA: hypothetical protein VJR47_09125 [Stellaceae bacterium]|nr:hypothetical protein [Stellaceae bacterium]
MRFRDSRGNSKISPPEPIATARQTIVGIFFAGCGKSNAARRLRACNAGIDLAIGKIVAANRSQQRIRETGRRDQRQPVRDDAKAKAERERA